MRRARVTIAIAVLTLSLALAAWRVAVDPPASIGLTFLAPLVGGGEPLTFLSNRATLGILLLALTGLEGIRSLAARYRR